MSRLRVVLPRDSSSVFHPDLCFQSWSSLVMHQRGNGVFAASFLTLDHEWIKQTEIENAHDGTKIDPVEW